MSYKRINNITGWAICIIACFVYLSTMEATGSFWDCGEFASSAYKIQVPHPPGAPLFILLGRLFMIPLSNPNNAILALNTMSALMSGFCILFLFWTITHFARKIVEKSSGGVLTNAQIFTIMAAGVVGALAYTFSDSFWYSAVESEVYATSSFFTALVFWAALKWEDAVSQEKLNGIKGRFTPADKWLILIFYLIGLAVGVHLLCLLTIPAIVMLYYFKRYKVTRWGTFWAFLIACAVTGIVQVPVIQWTIKWAGDFDILFTNSFGAPFFTGFTAFFVLLALVIFLLLRLAKKKDWHFLTLAMWSFAFIILGFTTYFTTLIRSNANVAIDMFNVDNPVSLVGYLSRQQYGDWPIVKGQDFTDEPISQSYKDVYVKGKTKYVKKGKELVTKYDPADLHFFPRMWDNSNDQGHADYYASFAGIQKDPKTGKYYEKPTMADNIAFFFSYQLNWMYFRYFMWNFAGKQNDLEGIDMGNVRDGNWLTGIPFWDNARLGDQSKMPQTLKDNKSHNKLFALPLLLGLLGLIYQYQKDKEDALVVGLLFFFTGIAIVIYLNQAGNQPRERDYAYAGSFYAFAIWIGIGVMWVKEMFDKYMNPKTSNYVAAGLCLLAVPVIMGSQEWNDHDRSQKTLARDIAKDYLESCAPNAILITFGDNDTYPLWFDQEVLGIRRDVRVINSSLLGTDWYLNELRYKINKSDPIPQIWSSDQVLGSNRDVIYYYPDLPGAKVDQTQPMDLYTMMKDYAGSDDPSKMYQASDDMINIFPTKNVEVPVDTALVRQNGTVNPDDTVLSKITFTIPKNALLKNESAILNIIAANKWKRPIYFTSPYGDLGFQQYLRTDGLTYRLVPVKNADVNRKWAYNVMMNKFAFGGADKPGTYFDEENRRHLNTLRMQFAQVAGNLAENGQLKEARDLLEKCDKNMLQQNFPYGMPSRREQQDLISSQFLYAAYKAGDSALAKKVSESLRTDLEQQVMYYNSLDENRQQYLAYDNQMVQQLLQQLQGMEQFFTKPQTLQPSPESTNKTINNLPVPKQDTQPRDKTQ
ncbi:MAG: glycosyltransferase family 117 protein [Ginsengibacter sp.]